MQDQHMTTEQEDSPATEHPIEEVPAPKARKRRADQEASKRPTATCPGCLGDARAIASPDGYECVNCGSVFQVAVDVQINGQSLSELFQSAKSGEVFTYTEPTRNGRTLDALVRHGVTSVFSNGGIVAAAVRAGFIVLAHSPRVIFQKP